MPLQFLQDGLVFPLGLGDKLLKRADHTVLHRLGDVLDVAAFTAAQQPLDKLSSVRLRLIPTEQRHIPVEKQIEFRLQPSQIEHVHVQSSADPPAMTGLVTKPAKA